jgi:hypothetical protein
MKARALPIVVALFLVAAAGLIAQQPAVTLEYFENSSGAMYVRMPDGAEYGLDQFGFGEELPLGSTLITMEGDYVELRMSATGTIFKISENTNFTVNTLQGRGGAAENSFSVAVGKFRAVVAKKDGSRYSFKGDTAICAVRGTQWYYEVIPGLQELVYVVDGVVEFTNAVGRTLAVEAGRAADALAAEFQAYLPPPEVINTLQEGMEFVRLRLEEVPGYLKEAAEAAKEEAAVAEAPPEEAPEQPPARAETPEWLVKMMSFLGMEIGTVTIADPATGSTKTWAEAIIQPKFALGKVRVALYLPIIYNSDIFDPNDWYHPAGNDEWSFGTDQATWQEATLDALNDLVLKIRYVEYGDLRDPFFFKLGNLNDITMGHGSIVRDYANDTNFPAERKVGLNLGLNMEKGGMEAMIDDAAYPRVFGLRGYVRPFAPGFRLGLGLTAVADLYPQQLPFGSTATYGDPMFFNAGVDLDLPIVEREPLSIVLFSDVAAMIPYFRESPGYGIPAGWATDAVWYGGQPRNWGVDAGILGNILMIGYRLDALYSVGTFRSPFYDQLYDFTSIDYVQQLVAYLSNPSDPAYDSRVFGVYGELGYTLEKVFYIKGGYLWPWQLTEGAAASWAEDELSLEVGIFPELLPVYGSISMVRRGLVTQLLTNSLTFFDENLILSGELDYSLSPILQLALIFKSNVVGGQWYPSVSILTRLNN